MWGTAESELVDRCLSADEAAWEHLVRQHTGLVYGMSYRFTRRRSEAQDLTQEVFLRVFQTLRSFRSAEASFTNWLVRLTRNLLIDNYRRAWNDRVTWSIEEHPGIEERFVSPTEHPDHAMAGRETSDLLQSSLAILSPVLRETIVLCDLQEMTYRETAVALGIREGTVKSRLNRGHAELARRMRRYRRAL
jgi:RNA polymerase sigma-70 factor, ECF subfamily